jgi:hypothetical protein
MLINICGVKFETIYLSEIPRKFPFVKSFINTFYNAESAISKIKIEIKIMSNDQLQLRAEKIG